jgi:excisionase family DNA binding protein
VTDRQVHQNAPAATGTASPHAEGDTVGPTLLLTAPQAARTLAISPRTLWSLTQRGEVPVVRIGRAVRYDRRDLVDYLDRLRSAQQRGRRG